MIRALVVDDFALMRILIREHVDRAPDVEVVAEASTGEEAIALAREHRPDVVLLDVNLPGIGGVETTRILQRIDPDMRIVAVSVHMDGAIPMRLLEMGVHGYVTKASGPEHLLEAIRTTSRGRRYLDPTLARNLALGQLHGHSSPLDALTPRELEVLTLITKGNRVGDIARRLCRSPKTISTLRGRVFEKLEVRSDVEATLLAMRHGLVEPVVHEP